jgi:hypothetical protein
MAKAYFQHKLLSRMDIVYQGAMRKLSARHIFVHNIWPEAWPGSLCGDPRVGLTGERVCHQINYLPAYGNHFAILFPMQVQYKQFSWVNLTASQY